MFTSAHLSSLNMRVAWILPQDRWQSLLESKVDSVPATKPLLLRCALAASCVQICNVRCLAMAEIRLVNMKLETERWQQQHFNWRTC